MNQDQARRMAEEMELPEAKWERLVGHHEDGREIWANAYSAAQVREAIAAALVKLTQGQEPVAMWVNQEQAFQAMVPTSTIQEGTLLYSALPIPSQQEERVRELESVLDVVLNQLKKWQANGGVKSGYEFIDVAITVIDAARSKEQGK